MEEFPLPRGRHSCNAIGPKLFIFGGYGWNSSCLNYTSWKWVDFLFLKFRTTSNSRWLGDLSILDTRLTEKNIFVPPESEDYFISAAINNVDEFGYFFLKEEKLFWTKN